MIKERQADVGFGSSLTKFYMNKFCQTATLENYLTALQATNKAWRWRGNCVSSRLNRS